MILPTAKQALMFNIKSINAGIGIQIIFVGSMCNFIRCTIYSVEY